MKISPGLSALEIFKEIGFALRHTLRPQFVSTMLLEVVRGQEGNYRVADYLKAWLIGLGIADVDGFIRGDVKVGKEFCEPIGFIYAKRKLGSLGPIRFQTVCLDEVEDFSIISSSEYFGYAITVSDTQDAGLPPSAMHFLNWTKDSLLQWF